MTFPDNISPVIRDTAFICSLELIDFVFYECKVTVDTVGEISNLVLPAEGHLDTLVCNSRTVLFRNGCCSVYVRCRQVDQNVFCSLIEVIDSTS